MYVCMYTGAVLPSLGGNKEIFFADWKFCQKAAEQKQTLRSKETILGAGCCELKAAGWREEGKQASRGHRGLQAIGS